MQLLSRQDSFDGDFDCPPGFDPAMVEKDSQSESPSIASFVPLMEKASKLNSLSCTDGAYDGLKCILEYVENELHMSTKLSLVEYVEVLVKEEAWKVVKFSEDDRLNKVTGKSFCSPFLSLFPSFLFNLLWLNNVKSTCYHHCIKVLSATTLCLPFLVAAGDL